MQRRVALTSLLRVHTMKHHGFGGRILTHKLFEPEGKFSGRHVDSTLNVATLKVLISHIDYYESSWTGEK